MHSNWDALVTSWDSNLTLELTVIGSTHWYCLLGNDGGGGGGGAILCFFQLY